MTESLNQSIRRSLSWSLAGNFTMRFGILLVGIVLARLLSAEQFGVYAIALALQTLMQTFATAGLGAALVRTENPEKLAPTVATVALVCGSVLFCAMALGSRRFAELLAVPDAAPVIAVLSFTMLLSGIAAVPFALLTRRFEQKEIFAASGVDFVVSTICSIGLVLLGLGPMALAISRVVAQSCSTVLLFVFSKWRPKFGLDLSEAVPALRFGLPAASACFLSVVLINIDNVVIARIAGQAALGFYALAFNISNWPMSALGQGIKFVSLAAFSESARRRGEQAITGRDPGLAAGVTFAWAAALPAGLLLAMLSVPLVQLVYGERWIPAAAPLAALGVFGALRVVFMLFDDYLLANGSSRMVMALQVVWIAVLTPAMVVGTHLMGIAGGGWSHVIICLVVMLPLYLYAVHSAGADVRAVLRGFVPPVLAAIPCGLVALWVSAQFGQPILALFFGAAVSFVVYIAVIYRWIMRAWESVRSSAGAVV